MKKDNSVICINKKRALLYKNFYIHVMQNKHIIKKIKTPLSVVKNKKH